MGNNFLLACLCLRIVFLLERCTAKCQTLDLGLIAQSSIRYRSILRGQFVENTVKRQYGEDQFPATTRNGQYGIRDQQLSFIGDAMEVFNQVWAKTKRSTITRYWMKSTFLCMSMWTCVKNSSNVLTRERCYESDFITRGKKIFERVQTVNLQMEQRLDPRQSTNLQIYINW